MKTMVLGATGATGKLLVSELLERGQLVKVIVRSPDKLPETLKQNPNLTIIHANLLEFSDAELNEQVKGCDAVASCLGHTPSFKGIFGQPRKLVTDATRRLCEAIKRSNPSKTLKYVLMNTTANSNRDLSEAISFGEQLVISLIRFLLPPHSDNEQAADYLRTQIAQDDEKLEWVAVRPDNLINEESASAYEVYASPIRSAIFNPGQTSRANVALFMAELISNEETWNKWKGQMPVLYNQ